jgi:hypothetical protein
MTPLDDSIMSRDQCQQDQDIARLGRKKDNPICFYKLIGFEIYKFGELYKHELFPRRAFTKVTATWDSLASSSGCTWQSMRSKQVQCLQCIPRQAVWEKHLPNKDKLTGESVISFRDMEAAHIVTHALCGPTHLDNLMPTM